MLRELSEHGPDTVGVFSGPDHVADVRGEVEPVSGCVAVAGSWNPCDADAERGPVLQTESPAQRAGHVAAAGGVSTAKGHVEIYTRKGRVMSGSLNLSRTGEVEVANCPC